MDKHRKAARQMVQEMAKTRDPLQANTIREVSEELQEWAIDITKFKVAVDEYADGDFRFFYRHQHGGRDIQVNGEYDEATGDTLQLAINLE